jgi:flagellar hook-length control protein FliK
VVGRTSDVSASVPVPSAQQKPARSQSTKDTSTSDSFGSLVDSNTQAISNNAPAQDPAPRRSDSSSSASDKSPRDSSSTGSAAQNKSSDAADNSAPAGNDTATDPARDSAKDATQDAGKSAKKDKSGTSDAASTEKSATKDGKTDGTDGLAAADAAAAAAAQLDAAQVAVPDPGLAVAAPVVPVDPNAAAGQASDAAPSPLTIAAAGIAASASTAAQIAGKSETTIPGDKSGKTGDAKIAADATATPGDTATDGTATDAKTSGGLIAAVDQGTPKTSFKAAATAQGDVSNIGQDGAKANAATAQTPATAATALAQSAKPQAEAGATGAKVDAKADATTDAKAGTSDPAAPASGTHAHTAAQTSVATTDTSAQAASAIQAPVTNTTSAATASTATLTATAATSTTVPIGGVPIEIAAAARAGKTRFDISLDPVDLGRIDVRINVDRNGQVTSHLTVEKPETLQMLRQDAPQLQRALDDAGFKTGSNGLSFSLRDQNSSGQNSGQNNDNGGNARRLIISEDDTVAAAPVGRSYGRMLGSSSGVDIRV